MAAKKKAKRALKKATRKVKAAARRPAKKAARKVKAATRKSAKKLGLKRPASGPKRATRKTKRPARKTAKPVAKPSIASKPRAPAVIEHFPAVATPPPPPTPQTVAPPEDLVEVSGIYGRIQVSESDPNAEVREVFDHFDRDKSGTIEVREFARICEALGVEADEEELATGFASVDSDADGRVTWDEFIGWWHESGR